MHDFCLGDMIDVELVLILVGTMKEKCVVKLLGCFFYIHRSLPPHTLTQKKKKNAKREGMLNTYCKQQCLGNKIKHCLIDIDQVPNRLYIICKAMSLKIKYVPLTTVLQLYCIALHPTPLNQETCAVIISLPFF